MNDEFIKATQSADHLISPAVIESGLKDLTFDEWRELLYNFPQFAPRYYWRTQRPESWREMRFVPQQFAVSVDWVLSNGGNWAQILDENPALFRERCNWAELTGCNWAWLLKWKPELEDLCDWNKLSDDDRRSLLNQQQPQFKIKSETAGEDENKELHKRPWRQTAPRAQPHRTVCRVPTREVVIFAVFFAHFKQFRHTANASKIPSSR